MTKKELMDYLERLAVEFRKDRKQYNRNKRLCGVSKAPSQKDIDAVLVMFINYIAYDQGLDLGLNVGHLKTMENE